jgi:hypothetical protein
MFTGMLALGGIWLAACGFLQLNQTILDGLPGQVSQ